MDYHCVCTVNVLAKNICTQFVWQTKLHYLKKVLNIALKLNMLKIIMLYYIWFSKQYNWYKEKQIPPNNMIICINFILVKYNITFIWIFNNRNFPDYSGCTVFLILDIYIFLLDKQIL